MKKELNEILMKYKQKTSKYNISWKQTAIKLSEEVSSLIEKLDNLKKAFIPLPQDFHVIKITPNLKDGEFLSDLSYKIREEFTKETSNLYIEDFIEDNSIYFAFPIERIILIDILKKRKIPYKDIGIYLRDEKNEL